MPTFTSPSAQTLLSRPKAYGTSDPANLAAGSTTFFPIQGDSSGEATSGVVRVLMMVPQSATFAQIQGARLDVTGNTLNVGATVEVISDSDGAVASTTIAAGTTGRIALTINQSVLGWYTRFVYWKITIPAGTGTLSINALNSRWVL